MTRGEGLMWLMAGCAFALFWTVAWMDLARWRTGLPLRTWLLLESRPGRWFTYVWMGLGALLIPMFLLIGIVRIVRGHTP